MKVPARLRVPKSKVQDYLLSSTHPVGRHKAAFFRELGFTPNDWDALADALHHHGRQGIPEREERTAYGRKLIVRGVLVGPHRSAVVLTVWFVENDRDEAVLVTAYPGGDGDGR